MYEGEKVATTTKDEGLSLVPHRFPLVLRVKNAVKRVPMRTWIVSGVFAGLLLVYTTQWKQQGAPRDLSNPTDLRALPGFDESEMVRSMSRDLDQQEEQINRFLREERQRTIIALALGFRGLAISNISNPNHPCFGQTETQCLNTFDSNRIAALTALTESNSERGTQGKKAKKRPESNPNLVFEPIFKRAQEVDRVTALRLAKILAKPVNSRTPSEQNWIDTDFPILNANLPVEELRPRPATLAQLLLQSQAAREKILLTSRESSIRAEQCLSLPPEQQKNLKECQ